MLDTIRTTLTRLHRKLAAAETVGEIRDVHSRAAALRKQAIETADVAMLDRTVAVMHACERRGGQFLRAGADSDLGHCGQRWKSGLIADRWRGQADLNDEENARDLEITIARARRGIGGRLSSNGVRARMVLISQSEGRAWTVRVQGDDGKWGWQIALNRRLASDRWTLTSYLCGIDWDAADPIKAAVELINEMPVAEDGGRCRKAA